MTRIIYSNNKLNQSAAFLLLFIGIAFLSACQSEAPSQPRAHTVHFEEINSVTHPLSSELSGRVSAYTVSEVRPQVNGIIKARHFEEGSDVKEGQVLYTIDPELYQATHNEAKAALARAEANASAANVKASRYTKLAKTGAMSVQDKDDAVSTAKQANAEVLAAKESLETARINLGYTEVRSPVSGRIGRSFVTPGTLVTMNQNEPLATVQQLSPVYVDVNQSTTELLRLREELAGGQISGNGSVKVRLVLENGSPYVKLGEGSRENPAWIEGRFMFSDVTVQQSTGVVSNRVTFENPDNMLLPGMYVRAIIDAGVRENAILVPQKAVSLNNRGLPQVYTLSKTAPENLPAENRRELSSDEYYIHLKTVAVGENSGARWLIDSGLSNKELILVEGAQKVRPGSIVRGLNTNADLDAIASSPDSSQES